MSPSYVFRSKCHRSPFSLYGPYMAIHLNCRCCYFQTPSVVHCMNATASAQSSTFLRNFYRQTIFATPPLKVPLFNACAVFPNVSRYYQAWSTPHFWTVRIGYGRVAHSVARILNGKITLEKICILKNFFLNFKPMSPRCSGTQG